MYEKQVWKVLYIFPDSTVRIYVFASSLHFVGIPEGFLWRLFLRHWSEFSWQILLCYSSDLPKLVLVTRKDPEKCPWTWWKTLFHFWLACVPSKARWETEFGGVLIWLRKPVVEYLSIRYGVYTIMMYPGLLNKYSTKHVSLRNDCARILWRWRGALLTARWPWLRN